MEYCINLGIWNSVFAVPSVIVDEHIKLAGAAQLKVILWILRHCGEKFTPEDISKVLNMETADVKDCMQYWVQMGVISVSDGKIQPSEQQELSVAETAAEKVGEPSRTPEQPSEPPKEIIRTTQNTKPVMPRSQKPDMEYIAERVKTDENIAYLLHSADEIFGRMISPNDKATLLLIHEDYGMPIEVILMMLGYLAGIGKCNTKYIEKMAENWYEKEIFTLELAEQQIQYLISSRENAKKVQRIVGDMHPPTDSEIQRANKWINEWHFNEDVIRAAYELCIDSIGKYSVKYMSGILEGWHKKGITTAEQAKAESNKKSPSVRNSKNARKEAYKANPDIELYKKISVIDEV